MCEITIIDDGLRIAQRGMSGCGENTQKTVAIVKERQTMKAWIKVMAMDKFNTH